jgi:hypothetical protein
MQLIIEPSTDKYHKWVGVFTDENGKETRTPFGDKAYEDFTQHRNRIRRSQYLARHRSNEDWLNPQSAGSLSRWILWETPSLQINIRQFKKRFNLK